MKQEDIEERLHRVVRGPQPSAPPTLRRFLRDLPETQAARRTGLLRWLRGPFGGAHGILRPMPLARRAQLAFALSIALVVGVGGALMFLSVRQAQVTTATSVQPSMNVPTPEITPRRSMSSEPSPLVIQPSADVAISWIGVPGTGNENEALPIKAVEVLDQYGLPSGGYLGVTVEPYGLNGLVRSDAGLYWDWSPASDVAPGLSLTSIAADGLGLTVVGGATQGIDGTMDGQIYYTTTEGAAWRPVPDETVFGGTPVQAIVYGPAGWVALGWDATTRAGAVRPVTEWYSKDGLSWQRVVQPLPIEGTWAFLLPTPRGYVLSGQELVPGAMNEPPIWFSTDGQTWHRSVTTDNSAQKLGKLFTATVTGQGKVIGICELGGATSSEIVESPDGGQSWSVVPVDPDGPDPHAFTAIATVGMDGPLIAVNGHEGSHLFFSMDGLKWQQATGKGLTPLGTMLVELGDRLESQPTMVLSYGQPSDGLGIWLASVPGSP
jgi:hypothetical protein